MKKEEGRGKELERKRRVNISKCAASVRHVRQPLEP
jgi:hypothetical protein